MTPGLILRTPRLDLVEMTTPEVMAIRDHDRAGRMWAPDYPTEGDVLIAELAVQAVPDTPSTATIDQTAVEAPRPWGPLQIRWRVDGLAIGGAGFKHPPDLLGVAEIGYGVVPSMRGRGVATEAVRGLIAFAGQHHVRALTAEADRTNRASHQVLRRCGFRPEPYAGTGQWFRLDLATWPWRGDSGLASVDTLGGRGVRSAASPIRPVNRPRRSTSRSSS